MPGEEGGGAPGGAAPAVAEAVQEAAAGEGRRRRRRKEPWERRKEREAIRAMIFSLLGLDRKGVNTRYEVPLCVELDPERERMLKEAAVKLGRTATFTLYPLRMPSGNVYVVPVRRTLVLGSREKRVVNSPPLAIWRYREKGSNSVVYLHLTWKTKWVLTQLEKMMTAKELNATPRLVDALYILLDDYLRVVEQLKRERALREEVAKVLSAVFRVEQKLDDAAAVINAIYDIVRRLDKARDDIHLIRTVLRRIEEKLAAIEEKLPEGARGELAKELETVKGLAALGSETAGNLASQLPDFVRDNPWLDQIRGKA